MLVLLHAQTHASAAPGFAHAFVRIIHAQHVSFSFVFHALCTLVDTTHPYKTLGQSRIHRGSCPSLTTCQWLPIFARPWENYIQSCLDRKWPCIYFKGFSFLIYQNISQNWHILSLLRSFAPFTRNFSRGGSDVMTSCRHTRISVNNTTAIFSQWINVLLFAFVPLHMTAVIFTRHIDQADKCFRYFILLTFM